MSTCKCFRCQKDYPSDKEDDIAGDGRCPDCTELAKRIAFKIDIEMGQKRHEIPTSRIRELFSEEEILRGEVAGAAKRIRLTDLGISPHG